jgi:hypothetical protein
MILLARSSTGSKNEPVQIVATPIRTLSWSGLRRLAGALSSRTPMRTSSFRDEKIYRG